MANAELAKAEAAGDDVAIQTAKAALKDKKKKQDRKSGLKHTVFKRATCKICGTPDIAYTGKTKKTASWSRHVCKGVHTKVSAAKLRVTWTK